MKGGYNSFVEGLAPKLRGAIALSVVRRFVNLRPKTALLALYDSHGSMALKSPSILSLSSNLESPTTILIPPGTCLAGPTMTPDPMYVP